MSVEETVRSVVTKIVRKPDTEFTATTTFKDLDADSLDIVQILVALEDTYDIEIIDDFFKKFSTAFTYSLSKVNLVLLQSQETPSVFSCSKMVFPYFFFHSHICLTNFSLPIFFLFIPS